MSDRFQRLFENSIAGIFVCDVVFDDAGKPVDVVLVQANPAFERMSSRPMKDVLGKKMTEAYPGVERTRIIETYCRVALTGEPANFEFVVDWTGKYYAVQAFQLVPGRCAVTMVDISPHKELEALRQVELNVVRSLNQAASIPSLLRDVASALASLPAVTGGGLYLLDGERRAFQLQTHWGLPPDFVAAVQTCGLDSENGRKVNSGQPVFRSFSTLPPVSSQDRLNRETGLRALAYFPLIYEGHALGCMNLASSRVDRFSEPMVQMIETLGNQIALAISRLWVEARVRQSEEDFRTLAENAMSGIVIVNDAFQHVYANQTSARLLGYTPAEIMGLSARDVLHPDAWSGIVSRRDRMRSALPVEPVLETVLVRKDGSFLPVEMSTAHTFWRGSECVLVVFQDVSLRKRMEREILEIGENERRRIGQDLHDALGQQLTGIAYMTGSLNALVKRDLPGEAELAERIEQELRRAIVMVRQIAMDLSFEGPEGGGLFGALERMARNIGQTAGVHLHLEQEGGRDVRNGAVAHHLYHIVAECVTNALRHGAARHISIRLQWKGDEGLLSIQNDGLPFDQQSGKSTGMGLKVMQHRAHQIGARLAIEPVTPAGVRITCGFPDLPAEGANLPRDLNSKGAHDAQEA